MLLFTAGKLVLLFGSSEGYLKLGNPPSSNAAALLLMPLFMFSRKKLFRKWIRSFRFACLVIIIFTQSDIRHLTA